MKFLLTNAAMLSPLQLGATRAEFSDRNFLTSDVWTAIEEHRPDIVCLNEVRPGCISSDWEAQVERSMGTQVRVLIPSSSSYVALVIRDLSIDVSLNQELKQSDRAATWTIRSDDVPGHEEGFRFSLTVVYAPARPDDRRIFFAEELVPILEDLHGLSLPYLLTGDFNDYPSLMDLETIGLIRERRHWRSELDGILNETRTCDMYRTLNPDTLQFSFTFRKDGRVFSRRRIDNTLAGETMSELIEDIQYTANPISYSLDHCAMVFHVQIGEQKRHRNHGFWRLHRNLLLSEKYVETIDTYIKSFDLLHHRKEPLVYIRTLIRGVMDFSVAYLTESKEGWRQRRITGAVDRYGSTVTELAGMVGPSTGLHELSAQAIEKYAESYKLDIAEIEKNRRQKIQAEERVPTAFTRDAIFHSRGSKTRINRLDEPTGLNSTTDQGTILEWIANYYTKLYTPDPVRYTSTNFDEEANNFLAQSISNNGQHDRIGIVAMRNLRKDLTLQEIINAGKRSNKSSSPGISGLPYQFWTMFSDTLGPRLVNMASAMMNGAKMHRHEPTIPVTILHKKGPRSRIQNYRPIALIDTHYRIPLIAISSKLGPAIANVIPDRQTAFIPGRFIMMNVLAIMLTLEAARLDMIQDKGSIMLSLDQEKAYDRVNREWLWKVFRFYNLPDRLKRFYQTYYGSMHSRYSVNGVFTRFVRLSCCLLQGDPSSTILYILVLQPFLNRIDNEKIGLTVATTFGIFTLTYIAFADDVWIFLKDQHSLSRFFDISSLYSRLSNSKFNESKSRIHNLGPTAATWRRGTTLAFKDLSDEFICLGIPVRVDGNVPVQTLRTALAKITNSGHWHGFHDFSILGRVNVLNSLLTSKMWYCLQMGPIAPWITKGMQRFITSYIFHSQRGLIAFPVICLPKNKGGLNVLHPECMATAMCGKWISFAMVQRVNVRHMFLLMYAHAMNEHRGRPPIFCVLPTRTYLTRSNVSPFFKRVIRTLTDLDCTLDLDLRKYTTDQALSLPWFNKQLYKNILPAGIRGLHSEEAGDPGRTWIAENAGRYTGWTFRDILFWDEDRHVLSVPDDDLVEFVLQSSRYGNSRHQYSGLTDLTSSWTDLRSLWKYVSHHMPRYISTRLPTEFRDLLQPIQRPISCNSFRRTTRGYSITFTGVESFDLETMIPWHDVLLYGKPMAEYKVKEARLYLQTKKKAKHWVFVPNHDLYYPTSEYAQREWSVQWRELHNKFRPYKQLSTYYMILHNRPGFAKDYSENNHLWEDFRRSLMATEEITDHSDHSDLDPEVDEDDDEEDIDYDPNGDQTDMYSRRSNYQTMTCLTCNEDIQDSVRHSYAECSTVQLFWKQIVRFFLSTIPPTDAVTLSPVVENERPITYRDVLFCFQLWRLEMEKNKPAWHRLMLWHSCAISILYKIREKSFREARLNKGKPHYSLDNAVTLFLAEYRVALVDVYVEQKRLDSMHTSGPNASTTNVKVFLELFIRNNSMVTPTERNGFGFTPMQQR